jgi:hypothetical protein
MAKIKKGVQSSLALHGYINIIDSGLGGHALQEIKEYEE